MAIPHGTGGYNRGCRCATCRASIRRYHADRKAGILRGRAGRQGRRRIWDVVDQEGELQGSIFAETLHAATMELKRVFPPHCVLREI